MTDHPAPPGAGPGRVARRFKAIAMGALPLPAWERLLRLRPVRALRDTLLGPSDAEHLAEGPVRFERLQFHFAAPYRTWLKAKQSGIENRICRLVLDRCRDGFACIDVGANAGFISVVMSMAVSPKGRVLSFEADPAVYEVLSRNIRDNGLQGVCRAFHAYVANDSEGETRVALDDVVRRLKVSRLDVLKVDVDGGDLDVLYGAAETLWRFRPLVVVEMTVNQDTIYRFLKDDIGYPTLVGMSGETVQPGNWPPNLIAGDGPIVIPPRGSLS
jgi:hypothetical protein